MNTSNCLSDDTLPERLGLRMNRRLAPEIPIDAFSTKSLVQVGPVKEMTAASALANLLKVDKGETGMTSLEDGFEIPQRFTKSGRKKATPFPVKLMKVLSQKEHSDTITWLPDGKSFTIVRPKAFVADILPSHFKQAKYSSFTRKLHRWGFQRHLRGEEAGAFFHKLFQRGRLDLVEKMTCHKDEPLSPGGTKLSPSMSPFSSSMPLMQQHQQHQQRQIGGQQKPSILSDPIISPAMARPMIGLPGTPLAMHNQIAQHSLQDPLAITRPQGIMNTTSMDPSSVPSPGSVDRLSAAIEMEVSRRFKETMAGTGGGSFPLGAFSQQSQVPFNPMMGAMGQAQSLNGLPTNQLQGLNMQLGNLLSKGGLDSFKGLNQTQLALMGATMSDATGSHQQNIGGADYPQQYSTASQQLQNAQLQQLMLRQHGWGGATNQSPFGYDGM